MSSYTKAEPGQIELQWETNSSASGYHAALALMQGRELADANLARAVTQPTAALASWLRGSDVNVDLFFDHLIPLSTAPQSRRELAETVLRKAVGPQQSTLLSDSLTAALDALENAFATASGDTPSDSPSSPRFLETEWRLHGRGLLRGIADLTDEDFLVEQARVIVAEPVQGGAGRPCWLYNTVLIEAVDADPVAALPEVLRLAWLVSMLNLELPRYSEGLGRGRLHQVGPMAMIPITLAAAERIELSQCDAGTLRLAVQHWAPLAGDPDEIACTLGDWWQVYNQARPPMSAALEALDAMLGHGKLA